MKIQTALLGEIEVDDSMVLNFSEGIPGFEQISRFVMIPMGEGTPFYYLQAVDDQDLCLLIAEPFVFFPDYEIDVPDEEMKKLDIAGENQQIAIYVVVSVPEDFKLATANLLAPLVINIQNKKGMQYVPGKSAYTPRHLLFQREQAVVAAQAGEGR